MRTFERIQKKEFDAFDNVVYLNRYIKLLGKYVQDKNLKRALTAQICLDFAFFHLGLIKPLWLKWASQRGGRAKKIKIGIRTLIEKHLPQLKIKTPRNMWNQLEKWYPTEESGYETPDCNYTVWFGRDVTDESPTGGYLYQRLLGEKKVPIKFKTFEKCFYEIKHGIDLPEA